MSTRVRKTMCATSSKKRMLYIAKKAACKENLLYSGTIPNRSYSKSIFTFIRWKHVRYRWPKPRIRYHTITDHVLSLNLRIIEIVFDVFWRVNLAGQICTVSGNLQSSPHNQATEEGPKRDWPSELIPAWVLLETPREMLDG